MRVLVRVRVHVHVRVHVRVRERVCAQARLMCVRWCVLVRGRLCVLVDCSERQRAARAG